MGKDGTFIVLNLTQTNYPYNAIEEALSNAIYHKSYAEEKPIEIQVLPNRIEILSYPGPLPPVTNASLQQRRVIARDYRNRRIGDFLKELKLTEGKATGFPLIIDEMAKNGNPAPIFYTDEERYLFLVTLPINPNWQVTKMVTKLTKAEVTELLSKNIDFQVIANILNDDVTEIKTYIRELLVTKIRTKSATKSLWKFIPLIDFLEIEKSREEIMDFLEIGNQTKNYNTNIKPLIDLGIIELTIQDAKRSKNQKYRLSVKGEKLQK